MAGFLRYEPQVGESVASEVQKMIAFARTHQRKTWMPCNEIILVADPQRADEPGYAQALVAEFWRKDLARSKVDDPRLQAESQRRLERLDNHVKALDRLDITRPERVMKWLTSLMQYWTDAAGHLLSHLAEEIEERGWRIDLTSLPEDATHEQAVRLAISSFLQASKDWKVDDILAANREMVRLQHR